MPHEDAADHSPEDGMKQGEQPEHRRQPPSYDTSKEGYAGIASGGHEDETGLQGAKDFAEMIVDTVREGLLVLDLDLRVQAANESFYQTFEVAPEETVGDLVYDLGGGQWDLPELRELLEDILPEDKIFNGFEVEHEFERIGRRIMLLNARRLDDHQMILLAIEDVTEERQSARELQLSEERLRLLVENAVEYVIFTMDPEGYITTWNAGAERILGWTAEEAIGERGTLIFTPEQRAEGVPDQEIDIARDDGMALDERWHQRKDGSRFWGSGVMVRLGDEELRGFAKIFRDNTDRREAEEALREVNETLEERVEERTRQVRKLASTLTMAEQEERRRISQILHDDLQQQLYGIQMKMSFIRNHAKTGDTEQLMRELGEAEEWILRGVELTRDLTVDLSPPILKSEGLTRTLEWLQSQMQDLHGLEVEIEAEGDLKTPEEDLRVLLFQIIRELLFNVTKHAGVKQATVELRDVNHHVEIVVSDEGAGFDVQAAEVQSAEEGGFGLFSVRERLDLFGGNIQIESAPGEGTEVTVSVPLRLE